ncbi:MAG: hypothetical protein R6U87_00530, partial [Thiohalospira sp.]
GGGVASTDVDSFNAVADFSSMEWVSAEAAFGGGDYGFTADSLQGTSLAQFFQFVLNENYEATGTIDVNGAFYGDAADGAMVSFSGSSTYGGGEIDGAGILERQ